MVEHWLSKGFIIAAIVTFTLFYAVTIVSAVQSYSTATPFLANQTYQSIQQERESSSSQSIFINNFSVSIILVIPIIGLLYFLWITWNTGQIIGLLATATGYTPLAYLIGISVPVAVLEILAYSILAAEASYLVILTVTRKDSAYRLIHHSWKSFILYLLVLVIAAITEANLIG